MLNRAQLANLADIGTARGQHPARSHICAKLGGNLELVPIADVRYFQADQKYVTVRHRQGEVIIEESLKSLALEFKPLFLRIHRNALVATLHLEGLHKTCQGRYEVFFNGIDDRLEVSRRHVAAVRRFLKSR